MRYKIKLIMIVIVLKLCILEINNFIFYSKVIIDLKHQEFDRDNK